MHNTNPTNTDLKNRSHSSPSSHRESPATNWMKIAIIGGTGHLGEGLSIRWAQKNEIIIGSRKPEKAFEAAERYLSEMKSLGCDTSKVEIRGMGNQDASNVADLIVLAVPYNHVFKTLESIYSELENKILVTPIVPMKKVGDHFEYTPPKQGSAALAIQESVPESTKVVSVYHNIPSCKLKDTSCDLGYDAVICADDDEAKQMIIDLTKEMNCLRPLYGGPLAVSNTVESITPLLLNLAIMNNLKDLGVNFS